MNEQIIAVDFDGTLCENKWPEIGEPNTELIGYLIMMQKKKKQLALRLFCGPVALEKCLIEL